jgi:hypothetical protein
MRVIEQRSKPRTEQGALADPTVSTRPFQGVRLQHPCRTG